MVLKSKIREVRVYNVVVCGSLIVFTDSLPAPLLFAPLSSRLTTHFAGNEAAGPAGTART